MTAVHHPTPSIRPATRRIPYDVPLLRPHAAPRTPPPSSLARDLALPVCAVGAALLVTALLLTGEYAHTSLALGFFTLPALAVAALARPRLVPVIVLVCWMFFDGFMVNGQAQLGWQQADRTSLLVLAAAGLAGAGGAAAVRAARRRFARDAGPPAGRGTRAD
ncbi:DUF4118 domain-containing protein [Streptomyces sp. NPDC101227]|uniref:DUF4118 domain-containing protein n=1 Tax=Streptomyces sp. NPDC101227 TaxID=3366136 RepID=UPI0037F35122